MNPSTVFSVARLSQRIGKRLERRVALNLSIMQMSRHALLLSGMMLAYTTLLPTAEAAEQPTAKAAITRTDVNKLLAKARLAMKAGKLLEADGLVSQAESAKVKYPVLNFGDTPTKVRRDLKKMQVKQASPVGSRFAAPASRSSLFPGGSTAARPSRRG